MCSTQLPRHVTVRFYRFALSERPVRNQTTNAFRYTRCTTSTLVNRVEVRSGIDAPSWTLQRQAQAGGTPPDRETSDLKARIHNTLWPTLVSAQLHPYAPHLTFCSLSPRLRPSLWPRQRDLDVRTSAAGDDLFGTPAHRLSITDASTQHKVRQRSCMPGLPTHDA